MHVQKCSAKWQTCSYLNAVVVARHKSLPSHSHSTASSPFAVLPRHEYALGPSCTSSWSSLHESPFVRDTLIVILSLDFACGWEKKRSPE